MRCDQARIDWSSDVDRSFEVSKNPKDSLLAKLSGPFAL
jgi:hypothetical protein